eukprot:CAMPEP_0168317196 /NCGR_PEP_ID=MMETSP0210-20121227/23211_1 /TAXON_ID=40633 /ORGANISM="Condylostoma magnum, Strain COL2" /LENGTH=49 /DNA_ID=CAMNT_0008312535 /DNA_START=830 /DNA_END=979 /DNA_ORIENTATION=-
MDLVFDADTDPILDENSKMKAFKGTTFDTDASVEPTFDTDTTGFTFASG